MICEYPFRHAIIDDFITANQVRQINAEWPEEWKKESGKGSMKWSTSILPPAAAAIAGSIDIRMVQKVVGIKGLIADPELFGAGLHCIPTGGFLKMHVDYNAHPTFCWHRRVNLLIYLNEVWDDSWNGHLQLGLENPVLIAPIGGRCVIFETHKDSWHGHPKILRCPENIQRRSLALYYYTKEPPQEAAHTTIYRRD